jgi:hypothetical protein
MAAMHVRRLPIYLLINNLVKWEPLDEPLEGYTVVIACMKALTPIALANLECCVRQDCPRMHELILVFDCPFEEIPPEVKRAVVEASGSIKIRLLTYDQRKLRIAKLFDLPWVYSWLAWTTAMAEARTRAVIIHDLDALPLDPGVFETLYDNWNQDRVEFCGIHPYLSNGVTKEMCLVTTFELVLDVAFVRARFRPFDLFNKLGLVDGRLVAYDTMLYAQQQSPRRVVRTINESMLVHPSQLITHYTDLMAGRNQFRGRLNSLVLLPYFLHLGGDSSAMAEVGPQLVANTATSAGMGFRGRKFYVDGISPSLWAWYEKQIRRVEQALFQRTRPEVETYLEGLIRRAGEHRTVGKELGADAVAEY